MTSGDHSTTSNTTLEWLLNARTAMATVTKSLADAPFSPAIETIDQFRNELTTIESLLIAKREQAGHSKRPTEGLVKQSGGASKNEAKKRTSRGSASPSSSETADASAATQTHTAVKPTIWFRSAHQPKAKPTFDDMVLLRVDCHHWIHETNTTII